jgi:hypothetical protein
MLFWQFQNRSNLMPEVVSQAQRFFLQFSKTYLLEIPTASNYIGLVRSKSALKTISPLYCNWYEKFDMSSERTIFH